MSIQDFDEIPTSELLRQALAYARNEPVLESDEYWARITQKLVESIMEGVPASEVKDELNTNAARREELKAKLAAADAPPPLLHPEMAGLYRQKVSGLAQALEHPETRTEASEALRGLIDAIVLTPNQGELQIELKGNLAAMLGAAPKCEEVTRNRRPLTANSVGCGGGI